MKKMYIDGKEVGEDRKRGGGCEGKWYEEGGVNEENTGDSVKWKCRTRNTDPNYLGENAKEKKKKPIRKKE